MGHEATPAKIAAAVCYRKREGHVDFLLVRTKGRGEEAGDKWTFPKGHVKSSETPARAAEREAVEEAGAIGEVEHASLTTYLYSKARGTEVDLVAAHLLHVTDRRDAAEGFRAPQWFGAEEAKKKLADRRERRYAEEHERVVEAALEEIAGDD